MLYSEDNKHKIVVTITAGLVTRMVYGGGGASECFWMLIKFQFLMWLMGPLKNCEKTLRWRFNDLCISFISYNSVNISPL